MEVTKEHKHQKPKDIYWYRWFETYEFPSIPIVQCPPNKTNGTPKTSTQKNIQKVFTAFAAGLTSREDHHLRPGESKQTNWRHPCWIYWYTRNVGFREGTLQGINISHLGKRKIIDSKCHFWGDILVLGRVIVWKKKITGKVGVSYLRLSGSVSEGPYGDYRIYVL